jgi:hypothetical protein
MKKPIIFYMLVQAFLVSCQPTPSIPKDTTQYTVSGQVVNTTDNTFYVGHISLEVRTSNFYPNVQDVTLATGNTDANGNFKLTYTHTDITNHGAQIYVVSPFFDFGGTPVNQTVNKIFYNSTKATLKLYLQTDKPLIAHQDTLFLGVAVDGPQPIEIDTILSTTSGYYKTYRIPKYPEAAIKWGRGWNDFGYKNGSFSNNKHYVWKYVNGDPFTDSIKVVY